MPLQARAGSSAQAPLGCPRSCWLPWASLVYSLGVRWVTPGSTLKSCRQEEMFFPCSDDFSLAWRKFLQTFHLHSFALEVGRGTRNFSTEEGKEWLAVSMSWDAKA